MTVEDVGTHRCPQREETVKGDVSIEVVILRDNLRDVSKGKI